MGLLVVWDRAQFKGAQSEDIARNGFDRRSLLAGAISFCGVGAGLLSGCGVDSPPMIGIWQPPHSAKLTADVETPEGARSGSSVIEVRWDKAGRGYEVRGEAAAVDLPGDQTLFVLLRASWSTDWAAYLHENVELAMLPANSSDYFQEIARNRQIWPVARRRTTVIQDSDNYPYLVRFKDRADPTSMELVDPDHLERTFGPGYRLKALSVQMTDGHFTSGIIKRLPWLEAIGHQRATIIPDPPELLRDSKPIQLINSKDFSTELFK